MIRILLKRRKSPNRNGDPLTIIGSEFLSAFGSTGIKLNLKTYLAKGPFTQRAIRRAMQQFFHTAALRMQYEYITELYSVLIFPLVTLLHRSMYPLCVKGPLLDKRHEMTQHYFQLHGCIWQSYFKNLFDSTCISCCNIAL